MVIVMLMFGSIAGQTNLVTHAESCSCYCLPVLGNVVPFVARRDEVRGFPNCLINKKSQSHDLKQKKKKEKKDKLAAVGFEPTPSK